MVVARPRIGKVIKVRVPQQLAKKIERRAKEEGVPKAEIIRRILSEAL